MKNRFMYLDVIRGLSILGILYVNVISFGWPELYDSTPSALWVTPTEQVIHEILRIFVQSNFYPIFAFLFGVSMTFIFRSSFKRAVNPYIVFAKRMLFLLFIGSIHAFFIWHGDILFVYALLGFLLIPFYRMNGKSLLVIATCLWVIPNILYIGYLFLEDTRLVTTDQSLVIQNVINNYQSGYLVGWIQNLYDWNVVYSLYNAPFVFISIFPMLLFGLAFGKSRFIDINALSRRSHIILMGSGIVGGFLKLLPLLDQESLHYHHISEAFGGPLVGLLYGTVIIRLYDKFGAASRLVANIGRMSMSNYLFQTLSFAFVFYILKFYGEMTPVNMLLLAVMISILQTLFSHYWFMSHQKGPIEALWGNYTYGIKNLFYKNSSI